jgi:putative hemolysin
VLIIVVGLLVLALIVFSSALVYTLRTYSRSRLSERLADEGPEGWLMWLDRHEGELQMLTGLLRLTLSMALFVIGQVWYGGGAWPGADLRAVIAPSVLTLLLLAIFAIAVPHALAMHAGEAILAHSLGLLALLRAVLWPFGRLFAGIEFFVRRLLGKAEPPDGAESERAEQEILDAVSEGEATGAVDEDKKEMIESVFELDETTVNAIMTPRTDINAVPVDASYEDVRNVIRNSGHSRIPVYEGSVDHIVGVVYAKDLLQLDPDGAFDARQVMRTAPYVPETKTLNELLNEFRAAKVQIALVLDEYGGTAGLATLEDILEELVGEIADEYDQKPPPAVNRIDDDTLEVDARLRISEINAELDIALPEEADYETIGGFVFATLGKIPAVGEELEHDNIRVQVVDAEARKIKRLRIHVQREKAEKA